MKNGANLDCPLNTEWERVKKDYIVISTKINETHDLINQMLDHVKHLSKLDALEDIRDTLLESATGRNHIDANMAVLIFKVLGAVIIGLLLILLFLLTGQHFNFLTLFNKGT